MNRNTTILKSLNETIQRARSTNLYKGKSLKEISELSELKSLPFTTKQDLRDNYPLVA